MRDEHTAYTPRDTLPYMTHAESYQVVKNFATITWFISVIDEQMDSYNNDSTNYILQ